MCGIAGILGNNWTNEDLHAMVHAHRHRGPDGEGVYVDPDRKAGLGHSRLSIIDLSDAGRQPMATNDGRLVVTFNGEIYNYPELRRELEGSYDFRTQSDTEVLLAAFEKWGAACLDRLIGMFAFVIWDESTKTAFAARDRFGVKPFYYHLRNDGTLFFASEIKAIHSAGVKRTADEKVWATYLTFGLYDHSARTFWDDVRSLPGGHSLTWANGRTSISRWYSLEERVGEEFDRRPDEEVRAEYFELMKESVRLRFRSDVPVGINLSGGLDSSTLLGLVHEVQGRDNDVKAFTFATGDANYDELPWVERMLSKTNHQLVVSKLTASEVPALAASVQLHQDEPFGGLPTLAYAKLFEKAHENGVTVLLDGNGMDEQWAGYDYYLAALDDRPAAIVQGSKDSPVRPECLTPGFRALAEPLALPDVFGDKLRNLQFRDATLTKIPRAMRFNDRVSMRASTELREPFLDHRLFELAMRQPAERKLNDGVRKAMLREIVKGFVADGLAEAPKRAMQTPQREWLRGELSDWADELVTAACATGWIDRRAVGEVWDRFRGGAGDNSFFIWQWISLGMMFGTKTEIGRTV